jgi:mRNA interferase RelE/StbE
MPAAVKMLKDIADRRVREKIRDVIDRLVEEPGKQGKPLIDDLAGYRSIRAVGQRYRIIYKVENDRVLVVVVALGIRKEGSKKDIYALAKKLIRLRLVDRPDDSA